MGAERWTVREGCVFVVSIVHPAARMPGDAHHGRGRGEIEFGRSLRTRSNFRRRVFCALHQLFLVNHASRTRIPSLLKNGHFCRPLVRRSRYLRVACPAEYLFEIRRSITATPGEPSVISPPSDIRITNIALGEQLADESSRTTIKLVYRRPGSDEPDSEDDEDDEEKENDNSDLSTTVLCSLTPGKVCA